MVTRSRSIAGFGAGIATAAIVGCAVWTLWPVPSDAEDQPKPAQSAAVQPADEAAVPTPVAAASTTPSAVPVSAVDGLTISSQSWRRGGLGSKALVTFTLRNSNEFAVKDIEIACTFSRRDGSHLTDRKRMIGDTVGMRSRKTFARVHVGFVNVNAEKAKCTAVAATRV